MVKYRFIDNLEYWPQSWLQQSIDGRGFTYSVICAPTSEFGCLFDWLKHIYNECQILSDKMNNYDEMFKNLVLSFVSKCYIASCPGIND